MLSNNAATDTNLDDAEIARRAWSAYIRAQTLSPSYAEQEFYANQQEAEEAQRPIRTLLAGHSMIVPALVQAAIFSTGRTLREHISETFAVPR